VGFRTKVLNATAISSLQTKNFHSTPFSKLHALCLLLLVNNPCCPRTVHGGSNSTRMSRRIHPPQNPPQNTLQNAPNPPVSHPSPQNPAIVLRTHNLQFWQPHPSNPRRSVVDSDDIETGASTSSSARAHTIQLKQYTKKFNKLYNQYYRYNNVDQTFALQKFRWTCLTKSRLARSIKIALP
jgi:hypothetical protein